MIIRLEAEADLANARDWYERQRGGLGAAFLLCVEECWNASTAHQKYTGWSITTSGGPSPVPIRRVLSHRGQ